MSRLVVVLVVLTAAIAAADPAKDAGTALEPFFRYWKTYREDPGSRANALGHDPQPADCDAAIANARKAGLKDDARIYERSARELKDEVQYDEKREPYVLLGDAAKICAQWRKMVLIAPVAYLMSEIVSTQASFSQVDPVSLGRDQSFHDKAKKCFEMVDAAIKAGAPADHKVKIHEKVMSIGEGKTAVCQAHLDWAKELDEKIKTAKAADREKRAAPYKAEGVAGQKLDLFLEYDDVYWRGGKDCQRISDIKQLAKAKALFHWLENPDGTHTIRKYTFNGNKVSGPVSKTYRKASEAQRGCK